MQLKKNNNIIVNTNEYTKYQINNYKKRDYTLEEHKGNNYSPMG